MQPFEKPLGYIYQEQHTFIQFGYSTSILNNQKIWKGSSVQEYFPHNIFYSNEKLEATWVCNRRDLVGKFMLIPT